MEVYLSHVPNCSRTVQALREQVVSLRAFAVPLYIYIYIYKESVCFPNTREPTYSKHCIYIYMYVYMCMYGMYVYVYTESSMCV